MKRCKFCGRRVERLVDAHILPRAFFEYSRIKANLKKNQPMLGINNSKGSFPKGKVWIGWYDSNLVCFACEAVFGVYDEYAAKILLQDECKQRPIIIQGELKGWEVATFDFVKLSLFFTSILWRAGASRLPQFKKIKLGTNLDILRQDILNCSLQSDISFVLARYSDIHGQCFFADPHPEMKKSIFGNIGVYRFYLGAGYIAYIKLGQKCFPHPANLMIGMVGQPLRIIRRDDYERTKEFSVMQKVFLDSNSQMVKINNKT